MSPAAKTVRQYLKELKNSKKEKPDQIRDALDIYVDLWERAIEKRVVNNDDEIQEAISKLDRHGGLHQLANE